VGAEPIDEPGGLNDSLSSTSRKLAARGAKRLLILLADLPLANAEAIDRVARAAADVALVPSGDGGTNALLLAPGAIEFQYGPNSAGRHVESARGAGLSVACLDEPPLALDIDTQDDIERLRESAGVAGHTLAVLRRLGLIDPARTSA
jgi:2-phospho-L-lactate guanylyltransferase